MRWLIPLYLLFLVGCTPVIPFIGKNTLHAGAATTTNTGGGSVTAIPKKQSNMVLWVAIGLGIVVVLLVKANREHVQGFQESKKGMDDAERDAANRSMSTKQGMFSRFLARLFK